jgi:hypothetical protein
VASAVAGGPACHGGEHPRVRDSELCSPAMNPKLARTYLAITAVLFVFFVLLTTVVRSAHPGALDARTALAPLFTLVGLTAIVWLAMVAVRNASVAVGNASVEYYRNYRENAPPDWVERPARVFMNLLEVPVLFYLAVILMLVTARCDEAQVHLAWVFVVLRIVHAAVYLAVNHVPTRFAAYAAGCVTLGVMWVRLGIDVL